MFCGSCLLLCYSASLTETLKLLLSYMIKIVLRSDRSLVLCTRAPCAVGRPRADFPSRVLNFSASTVLKEKKRKKKQKNLHRSFPPTPGYLPRVISGSRFYFLFIILTPSILVTVLSVSRLESAFSEVSDDVVMGRAPGYLALPHFPPAGGPCRIWS